MDSFQYFSGLPTCGDTKLVTLNYFITGFRIRILLGFAHLNINTQNT
jgi:hypothetical protein